MWAIVVKEFRELRRDRRTLAMMLVVPFLFLVVFGYAASFDVKQVLSEALRIPFGRIASYGEIARRLGKGKGAPEYWVAVVKPGRIMFEVGGTTKAVAIEALTLASHKLPIRTKITARPTYSETAAAA
jgi:hypothetical protein